VWRIDGRVQDFLNRPIEGDWPYLWLDAAYAKVREAGRRNVSTTMRQPVVEIKLGYQA
jgi:transposase-like protein